MQDSGASEAVGWLWGLGCERPLEGVRSQEVLSGVCMYMGGHQGSGVGIPPLQEESSFRAWGELTDGEPGTPLLPLLALESSMQGYSLAPVCPHLPHGHWGR